MMSSEAEFGLHELFFSKTDFRGIIQSGNTVFIRVSEYSSEELIQKPHNIIRHSDTPRAVFKLLWDYLKGNKPIVAYVKNRSKAGRYYWVLAMAFPMQDGYLSIRLKPSSSFFDKVKTLYAEMLKMESGHHSMEASSQYLIDSLKSLGYSSYEEFMMEALMAELQSRDDLLSVRDENQEFSQAVRYKDLAEIVTASKICTSCVRSGFEIANHLHANLDQLRTHNNDISNTCELVRFTTMNLAVFSTRVGEAGKTLGVVSATLNKLAQEISSSAENLEKTLRHFHTSVKEINFTFAISRFQIEMMNQLILENMNSAEDSNFSKNVATLSQLVSKSFETVEKTAVILIKTTRALLQACRQLKKATTGMDVINVVGRIEIVRIPDASASLSSILTDMEKLTESFKNAIHPLEKDCDKGVVGSLRIEEITKNISSKLQILNSFQRTQDFSLT